VDPVLVFLVLVAALFLLGAAGEWFFARTQVPDVVWLVAAGVVLGPVLGIVPTNALEPLRPFFGALTLIIVLFEGGSRLVLGDLVRAAPRGVALGVVGFVLTALAVAGFTWIASLLGAFPGWDMRHGMLLGCILGGSSSIVIMPSMAFARVEAEVARVVEVDSAVTDALVVVAALTVVDLMTGGAGAGDPGGVALALGRNFGIGIAGGAVAGVAWIPLLHVLAGRNRAYPITLAALFLLYAAVESVGGSAAMAVLTFAVLVGNADELVKRVRLSTGSWSPRMDGAVRDIHSQVAFIIKSFFFTYIGLMMSDRTEDLLLGGLLALVLLAARIPATWICTLRSGLRMDQVRLVAIALPRGMAAGVLSTMPFDRGVPGTERLSSVVFATVVASILLFAGGFRWIRASKSAEVATAPPSPAGDPLATAVPGGPA
jgi:cell volume regulation protein A